MCMCVCMPMEARRGHYNSLELELKVVVSCLTWIFFNANSLPHGHLRLMGKLQMQKIGRTNFKLTLLHLVLFTENYLKKKTHTHRGGTRLW